MRRRLIALIVAGCAAAGLPGLAGATGSGPHWVDSLPAGVDMYGNATALVGLDLDLDAEGNTDATLSLSGSLVIQRSDPLDDSMYYPGLRPIDGHLDVIDTEITSLSLTGGGGGLVAGAGLGQGGVLGSSLGAFAEQYGDNTLADSFFDVYVELHLGGGVYLYNHTPIRIDAVIDGVPVVATYDSGPVLIALYDSPAMGQGSCAANLTRLQLTTVPEPCMLTLLALGGLVLLARRRK